MTFSSSLYGFGNSQDFTASIWIKSTQYAKQNYWPNVIGAETNQATRSGWKILLHDANSNAKWLGQIFVSGSSFVCYGSTDVADGKWHHLTMVRSGSNLLMYEDGALANTCAASNGDLSNAANKLELGTNTGCGSCEYDGSADELAIWSRALGATEIAQLYRRGANRMKFQVRTCTAYDCSDQASFHGPDDTASTYFSELHNNYSQPEGGDVGASNLVLPGAPTMTFSNFTSLLLTNRRYFQYKAILESDDLGTSCNYGSGAVGCSPELKSVTTAQH